MCPAEKCQTMETSVKRRRKKEVEFCCIKERAFLVSWVGYNSAFFFLQAVAVPNDEEHQVVHLCALGTPLNKLISLKLRTTPATYDTEHGAVLWI